MDSILEEISSLVSNPIHGIPVREIVLLGQNVNGYHDTSAAGAEKYPISRPYQPTSGFNPLYRSKKMDQPGPRFVDLLDQVSSVHPEVRIRFTSPHPKDFPEEVLSLIASRDNICKSIHLPLQSGSTSTLQRMRRGYSQEAFLALVDRCRSIIPDVSLSTDIIAGFCGESEAEHQESLKVMRQVGFDTAYMFAYSLRDRTHAAHTMTDDVPEEIKQRRLREIIDVYHEGWCLPIYLTSALLGS
jgi:tRNA A37 methylthiotransferase MiaB